MHKLQYMQYTFIFISFISILAFILNFLWHNDNDICSHSFIIWIILFYKVISELILMLNYKYINIIIIVINITTSLFLLQYYNSICSIDNIEILIFYEINIHLLLIAVIYIMLHVKTIYTNYRNKKKEEIITTIVKRSTYRHMNE